MTARPRDDSARSLLVLAAAAFAAFLVVYLVAVQTEFGRTLDEAALAGGRAAPELAQDAADRLLRLVSIGSLAAAIAFLTGLAWLRRRPGLVLIPLAVIGLSLLATELFKLAILPRPDHVGGGSLFDNTYPSGHTTVAISIGLAALLIAPKPLRPAVAFLATGLAATTGIFVVTADWHRPSDPIGSYLLTVSVAALCAATIRARVEEPAVTAEPEKRRSADRLELTALLSGLAIFVGAGVVASLRYGADVDWNRFNLSFLLAAATIAIVAGFAVAGLLRALTSPRTPRSR